MGAALMLPSSRTHDARVLYRDGLPYEQVWCASCAAIGPLVITPPEERRFAFYLCDGCSKYGQIDGMYLVPDEEYEKAMQQEMQEQYGRALLPHELTDALNGKGPLALLAKECPFADGL